MELTEIFKEKVVEALAVVRNNFGGTDKAFAKKYDMNGAVYSRLLKGERESLLSQAKWLNLGRLLNVQLNKKTWNLANTIVFETTKEDLQKCKEHGISLMFVDECEIGKSAAAKYFSQTMQNVFYVDCSQAKTKTLFIKAIAITLGIDTSGRLSDIKAHIKYTLNILENPVMVFDEAGDLEYSAFLEIKEFWNATEYNCGFYMIGADGLREKIRRGISNKKVGFRENFSRFGSKYMSVVPATNEERLAFYQRLVKDVLEANVSDKSTIPKMIDKCLASHLEGDIAGLRRAKNLVLLSA